MEIRLAKEKDFNKIIELLKQVLNVHEKIRPDIFIPGTSKYNYSQLSNILEDETKFIYVAVDNNDIVIGYVFCQIINNLRTTNTYASKVLFIDDFRVDVACRGNNVGSLLFEHIKTVAKEMECQTITLNVWAGNKALEFYQKLDMKIKKIEMEYFL